jgi:hypothetical protein
LVAINYFSRAAYPADETIEPTDSVSLVQAFDRMYLLREAEQNVAGWGFREKLTGGGDRVGSTTATIELHGPWLLGRPAGAHRGRLGGGFDGQEYDIVSGDQQLHRDGAAARRPWPAAAGRTVRRVKPPLSGRATRRAFVKAPAGVPS